MSAPLGIFCGFYLCFFAFLYFICFLNFLITLGSTLYINLKQQHDWSLSFGIMIWEVVSTWYWLRTWEVFAIILFCQQSHRWKEDHYLEFLVRIGWTPFCLWTTTQNWLNSRLILVLCCTKWCLVVTFSNISCWSK